jgi:hypothetical protein
VGIAIDEIREQDFIEKEEAFQIRLGGKTLALLRKCSDIAPKLLLTTIPKISIFHLNDAKP